MARATVGVLIDYLRQFPAGDAVVLAMDAVEEPGEFVALEIALAQIEDGELDQGDETDARAFVETSARDVLGDLRLLQSVADGNYDGGSDEMLKSLGLEIDDGCVDVDEALEALYAMPLAVEATTTFEVVLGTGGPDRRLCFECDGSPGPVQPDPHTPPPIEYAVRHVFYGCSPDRSAEIELTGSDREIAEAFGRRVVPELGE